MIKTKVPSLLSIAILTLVTSFFWAFFSIYQVFSKKAQTDVPAKILEPVSPVLDQQLIDKIAGRFFFEESQIPENLGGSKNSPITVSASPSGEPAEQSTDNE